MQNKRLLLIGVAAGLLLALFVGAGCNRDEATKNAAKYYCPMHPHYTSDRPGDCPICNMRLVPTKDHGSPAATNSPAPKADGSSNATVSGRISVRIAPQKRQLIGLATSVVEQRNFSHTLRMPATVVHDETRLARIAPRFGGWVRSLQVNYTGQGVTKGDPLFTVYSPDLFTAENEYLLTLRNYQALTNSPAAQRDSAQTLLDSARRRLELLQVSPEEIRSLEQGGQASEELQFRAPVSGHVISKAAVEGKAFMAGETLYEIADLTHLWVRGYLYEYELAEVKVGQKARAVFPYLDNKVFDSSVSFIYPHIDPQTRRAEIRLELNNPHHELRPDMWANVEIEVELGTVLAVPASAVIDTGTRYLTFVEADQEHLEPRELKIGAKTDDYLQVLAGLKEGEKVVTRALFLVDSESQLKAAIAGMGSGSSGGTHTH